MNESKLKNRVFDDMQTKSDDVTRGIVGIIPESKTNELTSHNGFGSGVIFDKIDSTYYVVTAKHVVSDKNSKYKIFTKDTVFSGQTIETDVGINIEIPNDEYYESLLDGTIEYLSETTDLAILSFEYDGDLTILNFEDKELSKNDKLMVIGHPEGNRYQISYGYIKSNLKTVMNDKVIEHDAYIKQGSSGGVALTKNMKIAGINTSGSFTLFGKFKAGYMIPYNIVEENINKWRGNTNLEAKTMKVTINEKQYIINLENNDTAQKLVELLPLEVTMTELNGYEKYKYLSTGLPVHPYKPGNIEKGDVMLFDNGCIVIFYKSVDLPFEYTKIGHIDNLDDLGPDNIVAKFEK